MKYIILDIETGPAPLDAILAMAPEIERGKPDSRLKDPEKVAANMAAIEARYEADKRAVIERAALSAETGLVLAVGTLDDENYEGLYANETNDDASEKACLQGMALVLKQAAIDNVPVIGHNIKGFDLPFFMRRCWRHGVRFNRNDIFDGRYFRRNIVDTMETWAAGEYGRKMSLNNLAKYFGLPEKLGTGDQFAQWWNGGERD